VIGVPSHRIAIGELVEGCVHQAVGLDIRLD
jgi:hypothetical protein